MENIADNHPAAVQAPTLPPVRIQAGHSIQKDDIPFSFNKGIHNSLSGSELFSLFTADVIKEDKIFVR